MSRRAFALLAALWVVPPVAQAQDADAGTEAAVPDTVEPLAPAEVGRRIEETFRELQEIGPRLRRQEEFLVVRRRLPGFTRTVTALREDPALERLDSLHPTSLHDLEQEWNRVRARLVGWQEALEAQGSTLAEEREHLLRTRRVWRLTLEVEREHALPPSQVERIGALLENMRRVKDRIDRRLDEVLGLQGELSDQGLRIAATSARIQAARRTARQRRANRDHYAIWEGWHRLEELDEPPVVGAGLVVHRASFSTFSRNERGPLTAHALIFAVLAASFLWMRVRSTRPFRPVRRHSAHRALRERPLASALLVGLVIAPVLYPYLPGVAVAAAMVLMVPAAARVSAYLLVAARPPILGLLSLCVVAVPINIGVVPEAFQRVVVLAVVLAAIGLAGWLSWPRFAAELRASDPTRRRLYHLVQLSVLPLGLALYFDLSGYTERGELWMAGTLALVEQAIGLFFAIELCTAAIREALRSRIAARLSYTVRKRRRQVGNIFAKVLRWGGVLALVYVTLSNFDVLAPTLEALRLAFRKTFVFGEIELTAGDVVAFLAMIIGTIAVMRVVHALLELELLPRLDLEQGISSAISLSVSYVLVAIGVVLAFGSAGVGPERLALLGGALGVGIGFGLQNVVSNFVSGLILVAERPIKVGDVIEIGDLVGTMQRIGIRSSTVQSLDGAEVIVPNADLIAGHLVNWTHTDARRRLELTIGTGYQHAPDEVVRVLTKVVSSQPGMLSAPPPTVLCAGFGDSSIDFVIRGWTAGYFDAIEVRSRLALRVYAALEQEGIEIPFPQRDLHLVSVSEDAAKRIRDEEAQ